MSVLNRLTRNLIHDARLGKQLWLARSAASTLGRSSASMLLSQPTMTSDGRLVSYRHSHSGRFNSGIVFVPQQEAWIIERLGKFNKILGKLFVW